MSTRGNQNSEFNDQINLRAIVFRYLSYWKWFVLSVFICFFISYVYVRYTPKQYESTAKLLIKVEQGGVYSELAAFQDLGLFEGNSGYNNLRNEKEILQSRPIIEQVVRSLDLHIKYNLLGSKTGIVRKEYYKNAPFLFKVINESIDSVNAYQSFDVHIVDEGHFKFIGPSEFGDKSYQFGDTLENGINKFTLIKSENFRKHLVSRDFKITIAPIKFVVAQFQAKLKVEPMDEMMDILLLKIQGTNVKKNNDFLDSLITFHTNQTISDQLSIHRNTTSFINERIATLSEELADVEIDGEKYKSNNELTDVLMDEKSLHDKTLINDKQLIQAEIQLELTAYLQEFLSNISDKETLLPVNIGVDQHSVNEYVAEYNKTALNRLKLIQLSSEKNPQVAKLDTELDYIRSSLNASLKNSKTSIEMEVRRLKTEQSIIDNGISQLPKHARILRSIERQQQVKETLYLYLLQKREENEIASAVTEGNSKVIESAYSSGMPVAPRKAVYYLFSMIIGLVFPASIIYISGFLSNKVQSKDDLKEYDLPHLGNIPWNKEAGLISSASSNNSLAESIRILRTNISFMLGRKDKDGKVILLTSTMPLEGKSFLTLNLGASYAITDKKTIVVGLDLRAPKLLKYLGYGETKGVSDYIQEENGEYGKYVIRDKNINNLYYLPSGTTPPNPAELLMRSELVGLIDDLKKNFDLVLIDTAPVSLVTDTLLISHLADASVYVIRANKLDKGQLEFVSELSKSGKLPHMGVVINGVKENSVNGYGYGYGYGENNQPKPIWKRLFRR